MPQAGQLTAGSWFHLMKGGLIIGHAPRELAGFSLDMVDRSQHSTPQSFVSVHVGAV